MDNPLLLLREFIFQVINNRLYGNNIVIIYQKELICHNYDIYSIK